MIPLTHENNHSHEMRVPEMQIFMGTAQADLACRLPKMPQPAMELEMIKSAYERFFSKVKKTATCWIWEGGIMTTAKVQP